MKVSFDPITIIISMGTIQGYFFSLLFFTLKKGNRTANRILAVLFFVISTSIISSVLIFTNLYHYFPHFIRIEMLLLFLFPGLLYFYVKALTERKFKFEINSLIHILPFLIAFFCLFSFLIKDGSYKIEYLNNMLKGQLNILNLILNIFLIVIYWIYIISILRKIKKHQKIIKQNFSSIEKIDLIWIKIFTVAFIIATLISQILIILIIFFNFSYLILYKYFALIIALAIFYLGYRGLSQKNIFEKLELCIRKNENIKKQIVDYIESKKFYKNPDCKITELETALNMPQKTIMNAISESSVKNFYDFINIYRIKEAKNYLLKSETKNISNLHMKFGFKSESLFRQIFKKHTNFFPIQFIQNSLKKKSKKNNITIGLFMDTLNNSFNISILKGVTKFSQENGINVICFNGGSFNHSGYKTTQKTKIYELACNNNLDGIISISLSTGGFIKKNDPTGYHSIFTDIPLVNIGMEIDGKSCLKIDITKGLKELLNHLIIDHKYKKIAYINSSENSTVSIQQLNIYKNILKEYDIKFDSKLFVSGAFSGTPGKKAIKILLDERKVTFDAVFASNEDIARHAIQELQDRGISVPDDIAVVGLDNTAENIYNKKSLTTVFQPTFELGYRAADKLFKIINKEETRVNVTLNTEFIRRVSCGCKNGNKENKAKNLTASINNQIKETSILRNYERNRNLYLINQTFLTIYNMDSFKKVLIKELPKIGIKTFYLSIFKNNNKYTNNKYSEILAAFKNYSSINYTNEEKIFQTKDLIPGGFKNNEKECYIIMSLYFDKEELGFVVFESEIIDKAEYELLIMALSSTLKSILLHEKLNRKKIEKDNNRCSGILKKYEKINLTGVETIKLYKKIVSFIEGKKIYTDPDLTLPTLAEKLSITLNHLSFIINKHVGANFYDFINYYRVEEAKNYLIESKDINILEVAFKSGFNSKSTFNKIFKKQTKTTPSEFRKIFYNLKN